MNISPIESLLVVFTYEKRTGKTVTIAEIRDGSFGPKLTQQDFDTTLQVNLYSKNCLTYSTQLIDVINSVLAYLCYDLPAKKRMKFLKHMLLL